MSPKVVLVGAPGSGKTTVGRALARSLNVAFRDTDADIEAQRASYVRQLQWYAHALSKLSSLPARGILLGV